MCARCYPFKIRGHCFRNMNPQACWHSLSHLYTRDILTIVKSWHEYPWLKLVSQDVVQQLVLTVPHIRTWWENPPIFPSTSVGWSGLSCFSLAICGPGAHGCQEGPITRTAFFPVNDNAFPSLTGCSKWPVQLFQVKKLLGSIFLPTLLFLQPKGQHVLKTSFY